jgi:REP element-mobilizing transposase RayT
MNQPLAYFLTFHCYGTWLQGDAPGSVDREHNELGTPFLPPDPEKRLAQEQKMAQPAYHLDDKRRRLVLRALQEVCQYRGWRLLAAHVRTTHLHVVVTADARPEKVMNDFKAYASRALNAAGLDLADRMRWSRHGSTRYLNTEDEVATAVDYVLRRQGDPLATYDGTAEATRPLANARGS